TRTVTKFNIAEHIIVQNAWPRTYVRNFMPIQIKPCRNAHKDYTTLIYINNSMRARVAISCRIGYPTGQIFVFATEEYIDIIDFLDIFNQMVYLGNHGFLVANWHTLFDCRIASLVFDRLENASWNYEDIQADYAVTNFIEHITR